MRYLILYRDNLQYSKLDKSEREVRLLESALQETKNENSVLRIKQEEAMKLWDGLEYKFSSSKTYCDQLMDTLQQVAHQGGEGLSETQDLIRDSVLHVDVYHAYIYKGWKIGRASCRERV